MNGLRAVYWYSLLIVGGIVVVLVGFFTVRNRLQRERAKREALAWIASGSIPSAAACDRVNEVLIKFRDNQECAEILSRLDALSGRGDKY